MILWQKDRLAKDRSTYFFGYFWYLMLLKKKMRLVVFTLLSYKKRNNTFYYFKSLHALSVAFVFSYKNLHPEN